jgi:hypothetical protein
MKDEMTCQGGSSTCCDTTMIGVVTLAAPLFEGPARA